MEANQFDHVGKPICDPMSRALRGEGRARTARSSVQALSVLQSRPRVMVGSVTSATVAVGATTAIIPLLRGNGKGVALEFLGGACGVLGGSCGHRERPRRDADKAVEATGERALVREAGAAASARARSVPACRRCLDRSTRRRMTDWSGGPVAQRVNSAAPEIPGSRSGSVTGLLRACCGRVGGVGAPRQTVRIQVACRKTGVMSAHPTARLRFALPVRLKRLSHSTDLQ
jgi:hypothetical protein